MMPIPRLPAVLTLLASLTWPLGAGEAPPRRVLVLANEATLAGFIEEEPAGYRIKNETGETVVPKRSVLRVCDRMEDAYAFLKSRANLRDAHERLRLARWCWSHDLLDEARAEADAATRLDPRIVEAQRLAKTLQSAQPSPPSARKPPTKLNDAPVRTVALQPSTEHTYAPETLQSFTRKIQPILFNGCGLGSCHGGVNKNGFDLQRPFGQGTVPAHMTRNNLLQALNLLDREDPGSSKLLRKALEQHGGGTRPPFPGKDSVPYQTLEAWVMETCGVNAQRTTFAKVDAETTDAPATGQDTGFAAGRPGGGKTFAAPNGEETPRFPAGDPPAVSRPEPIVPIRSKDTPMGPLTEDPAAKPHATPPSRPPFQGGEPVSTSQDSGKGPAAKRLDVKKPVKPVDPFDPLPFNRQHHPDRQ
jgi:hypothetical protein